MRYNIGLISTLLLFGLSACNLDRVTDMAEVSEGAEINSRVVESAEGARWIYWGAIAKFSQLFGAAAGNVAFFTDELSRQPNMPQGPLDSRIRIGVQDGTQHVVVSDLANTAQSTRVQLQQAIQLLDKHSGLAGNTMKAHSYGLLGMVHLILADNFCSGIPLSESRWGGEFIPGKGYPTDSLYQRAIHYADSGMSLSSDSAEVVTLLLGVKARALNSLGRYEEAADVAELIGNSDNVGEVFYTNQPAGATGHPAINIDTAGYIVLNNKGQNGLVWVSDSLARQDTRIPIRSTASNFVHPLKPSFFFGTRTISFASGAEARLIEAEYLLASNDIAGFMEKINTVRRMYNTVSGSQLPDTVDPGTESGRVDLLFRERAYTFYVSGRRLGDMRRMVRHYGREPNDVWPTGQSEGSQFILYGPNYVFTPEVPGTGRESTHNSLYFECESYAP